jgi:dephospho-CoA kinase
MKQILIGLIGTIGAGKTTVSDYLVKKGFFRVVMGDLVREKTREKRMELTRENLQAVQKEYRGKFGEEYFIKETVKRLKDSGKEKLLIDGIRTPIDAEEAKKAGAIIILVDAPARIRFERLKARKREGDAQTMQDFLEQEKAEWGLFRFNETLRYVNYKLENYGSIKELYKNTDELVGKIVKE